MKEVDLVVVGHIAQPARLYAESPIEKAVHIDMQYAGHGADNLLYNSCRVLAMKREHIRVSYLTDVINRSKRPLKILHAFSDAEFEEYSKAVQRVRKNEHKPLYKCFFGEEYLRIGYAPHITYDVWWDVGNHAIWTFERAFSRRIQGHLEETWGSYPSMNRTGFVVPNQKAT